MEMRQKEGVESMTREEAIDIMGVIVHMLDKDYDTEQVEEALEMAIQALSQEPTVTSTDEPMTMVYPTIFCEDAISRKKAICVISACNGKSAQIEALEQLPSVTQKSGKWDRLYSWLNDMRLGIAPDETVTDIDERHCRESQTDILDEIMEWMIKADKEQTE